MYQHIVAPSIGIGVEESIKALNTHGRLVKRENQNLEDDLKEIQLVLDIENITAEPFISRCIFSDIKGLASYDFEMLYGTSDDRGWKYTYHGLYKPYYNKLIEELRRNPNTRRARLCIGALNPDLIYSEDPPCWIEALFVIVDRKLEGTFIFRSNDGVKAFPMNIHALSMLQIQIAEDVGVQPGAMHYIANNFHCYSRDFELIEQYCKNFETASEKRRFYSMDDIFKAWEDVSK